jgi:hypothetical protein
MTGTSKWAAAIFIGYASAVALGQSKVTVCDTRAADHPCPSFDSLVPSK